MTEFLNVELTEKIIGCAYEVHKVLGSGFVEKVYENAFACELRTNCLLVECQKPIVVRYKGWVVGEYVADIVVENVIIIELKAIEQIVDVHEVQLKNYLKATGLEVGLLINFGKSVEIRRKYVARTNMK